MKVFKQEYTLQERAGPQMRGLPWVSSASYEGHTHEGAEHPLGKEDFEKTHWKDPDAGRDWGLEVKGITEEEMGGWHHRLNGHEFE